MLVLNRIYEDKSESVVLKAAVLLIGTSDEADICLKGNGLPEVAVRLEKDTNGYSVENIEKSKAILLNGRSFKQAELKAGDRLEVGEHVFLLQHPDASGASAKKSLPPSDQHTLYQKSLQLFAQAAAEEKDLNRVLKKILNIITGLTSGTEAILFTLSSEGAPEAVVSSDGMESPEAHFSDTVIQEVLKTGKGVAIANAMDDGKFSGARSVMALQLNSVMCTPIFLAGKKIGLIYVGCRKGFVTYGEPDLQSLNIYAMIAGMLIHNVAYISQQRASIQRLVAAGAEKGLIAESPAMKKVMDRIQSVARSQIGILLQGETGTGKDVIAGFVHRSSDRAEKPFIAVNCTSLRGELLESELFGYRKGAFTGAIADRKGLFQAAHGGTLFLDEIGEMDVGLQAKLLRVLETGKVRPVGDVNEETVNVRVVAATNKDLKDLVTKGDFREDLFFRLAQVVVPLPALRERGEDILLLAHFYLEKFKAQYPHKEIHDFHPEAVQAIMTHEWPGNVREMVNVIHRSVLVSESPLVKLDTDSFNPSFAGLEEATRRFQRDYISRALVMKGGNKEQTAELLQMSRSTFFRYLSQLEVE